MKFYRHFISVLILFGILTNCFSYWVLSSSFSFNKKYISTVLCTNKDRPELHCEGKCFMHIKLKELEQKNKHQQDQLKRTIETVAPNSISLLTPVYDMVISVPVVGYLQKKPIKTVVSIFQPPKQA